MNRINGGLIRINGLISFSYAYTYAGLQPHRTFVMTLATLLFASGKAQGTRRACRMRAEAMCRYTILYMWEDAVFFDFRELC